MNSQTVTKNDIVFQFVGQGVLKIGIAADLFESERVFRESMIKFDAAMQPLIGVRYFTTNLVVLSISLNSTLKCNSK